MERIKEALEKARVERFETIGNSEPALVNASPGTVSPPQDLRNMMYLVLALVAFVVIGLMFMFWYISDLKSHFIRQDDTRAEVTEPLPETPDPPVVSARLEQQIVQVVSGGEADPEQATQADSGEIVDVYYGNALIRMQVVGKLSGDDADYLAALDKLKQGSGSPASARTIAEGDAKNIRANSLETDDSVDHFNRVIIEDTANGNATNRLTFADRVQQVIQDNSGSTGQSGQDQAYIASLDIASVERKNETRIIEVKRGDSLWKIAERAYGNGFKYPLIFEANPHLKDPDRIAVGDFLRVPLQESPQPT